MEKEVQTGKVITAKIRTETGVTPCVIRARLDAVEKAAKMTSDALDKQGNEILNDETST